MKRALFLDRDGTILVEPEADQQIDRLEKFEFVKGAISGLATIASQMEYELILITNQDGLGTDSFPREHFEPLQHLMERVLRSEGVKFSTVLIDTSFAHQNLPTRKPGTGLLQTYLSGDYDIPNSVVIGDRLTDMELAKNLGCRGVRLWGEFDRDAWYEQARSWPEVLGLLRDSDRRTTIRRKTSETDISVRVNLDSGAVGVIATGLPFFDHMLDQVGRHGGFELHLNCRGDLHIDQHHTIEDSALALGEALRSALGQKKGVERYSWVLPMDEACAEVSIDLSGRSYLVWEVPFSRLEVGGVPTEMFQHFFYSLAQSLKATIHIRAKADNDHHLIESVFKGLARCLRAATKRSGGGVPSSKGAL